LNVCGLLCALYSHFVAYSYQRHIEDALDAAGNDQVVKEKIIYWQNCGNRWAYYSRNTVPRNRFIQTSNYADQNHRSIAANAPDDPDRSLEQNIVDIMGRDKTLADTRQKAQYKWKAVENNHLNDMPGERADDLTLARKMLVKELISILSQNMNIPNNIM